MTKVQIVDALAEKLSVTKKLAAQFVDEYAKLAYAEAKNEFVLPGLGKLTVVKRNARQGRNPQTNEKITIAAKEVVKFKVAKACSDAVLGK